MTSKQIALTLIAIVAIILLAASISRVLAGAWVEGLIGIAAGAGLLWAAVVRRRFG